MAPAPLLFLNCYAEYAHTECLYAESHYADCRDVLWPML
jgi:hypothetical protein